MPITKKYKKIIIGNWKANPESHEAAKHIIKSVKRCALKLTKTEVIVCPPSVYIHDVKEGPNLNLGAQDVSIYDVGSHTGEVTAEMLRDSGVKYCIVGHSERRKNGETDEIVSKKVGALHNAGITAIVCVGEEERDAGGLYINKLKEQIKQSLQKVEKKNTGLLMIAYEPVWAIGGSFAMPTAELHETTIFIKKTLADLFGHDYVLKVSILYGGSVTFRNAGEIVSEGHVDGLLVGRESVNPQGFNETLRVIDTL